VRFAHPVTLATVMAGNAAIYALRAPTPEARSGHARLTPTAEGDKRFFASFCSQKEDSYFVYGLGA
jgi:hypothetical protein